MQSRFLFDYLCTKLQEGMRNIMLYMSLMLTILAVSTDVQASADGRLSAWLEEVVEQDAQEAKNQVGRRATDGTEQLFGIIINVSGDKVLYMGFGGKVKVAQKSDCTLLPLNPGIAAGQTVKANFVGKVRPDYKVKKVDAARGRVWLEKDGNEEIKSFLEIVK